MTLVEFERLFMMAGYSERPDQLAQPRVPTGEKGVGRFATDRLGNSLSVSTKTRKQGDVLEVQINWREFDDRRKKFSDVKAPFRHVRQPGLFPQGHGTILRISPLRSSWDRAELAQLRAALAELLDPYDPPANFRIEFDVTGSEKLSGPIEPPTLDTPDVEIRFRIEKNGQRKRWQRTQEEGRSAAHVIPATADAKLLTGLSGRLMYYLRRPRASQVDGTSPAVRVYRDGFQIQPFGDVKADWLQIGEKRAKRAGHAHIVPSRLYGFVAIKRSQHRELRDITSREALLDTAEARALVGILRDELVNLEDVIRTRVTEPRWKKNQERRAIELEQARLHALGTMSFGLAHELRQPLQVIRSEADNIVKKLALIGIEDEDIAGSQASIDNNISRIDKNIRFIASLSNADLDEATEVDLAALIQRECQFFEHPAAAAGVKLTFSLPPAQQAVVNETGIAIVITNLLTNAIQAFDSAGDRAQRIVNVTLKRMRSDHVIEVADTAGGIPEEVSAKIFSKFVTQKTGGWGVGLYNCKLIVGAHGGSIDYETRIGVGTKFVMTLPQKRIAQV
jgi:signal transduction histidine kinase